MSKDVQIAYLYKIWYSYDKLKNLRTDDPFFKLNYYNFLSEILQSYSKLIQCETTSEHKYSQFFSSDEFRKKYNIKQFDDNEFMGLWLQANKQINRRNSKLLYEYVMGRFNEININDFKIYI